MAPTNLRSARAHERVARSGYSSHFISPKKLRDGKYKKLVVYPNPPPTLSALPPSAPPPPPPASPPSVLPPPSPPPPCANRFPWGYSITIGQLHRCKYLKCPHFRRLHRRRRLRRCCLCCHRHRRPCSAGLAPIAFCGVIQLLLGDCIGVST